MADSKYGPLYTKDDVERIVTAHGAGAGDDLDTILSEFQGTFPVDEPLFLMRAQDLVTMDAIDAYVQQAKAYGAPPEFVERAQKTLDELIEWQNVNAKRTKVPD